MATESSFGEHSSNKGERSTDNWFRQNTNVGKEIGVIAEFGYQISPDGESLQ